MRTLFLILIALLAAACAPPDGAGSVDLYAAVSLRPALEAAKERLESVAGTSIVFNFGASSDLARQIVAARRADLFLSADTIQMDAVEGSGLVAEGTRKTFLTNRLVVVVPVGSTNTPAPTHEGGSVGALEARGGGAAEGSADASGGMPPGHGGARGPEPHPGAGVAPVPLEDSQAMAARLFGPGVTRVSIADPDAVPAGRYAAAWLKKAGLWESVRARIVPAIDARAALAAVESGGAQVGVVYATDAALSEKIRVAFEVPPGEGPEIGYVIAVMEGGDATEAAARLAGFLSGEGAREIFGAYGFGVM